jgi:hypothetical protein
MNKGYVLKRYSRNVMAGLLALLGGSLQAATVFAPTDGDLNFLFGDLQGATLAMFDDSDQTYAGSSLTIPVPSIVGIFGPTNPGGDYLATNSLGDTPLVLTGSNQFILGLFVGGQWLADSSVQSNGANSYTVNFDNGGSVLSIDLQVISAIPIPGAIWLFGSGLVALVGLQKRGKLAGRALN